LPLRTPLLLCKWLVTYPGGQAIGWSFLDANASSGDGHTSWSDARNLVRSTLADLGLADPVIVSCNAG